jgi:uncharacterized protein (DUF58 family)
VELKRVQQFVDSLRQRRNDDAARPPATPPQGSSSPDAATKPATRASSAAPAKKTLAFDPQALTKLGPLELIARSVVDGLLSGKHRSTHKGGCSDFAEFRPYARGDDIRQLDWRHYARSDRYYVKQYDDETNLQALLVVDASGSMGFGMSTVTKWRYAQMTAACMAQLLVRQRDGAGLAMEGSGQLEYLRPSSQAGHLARVMEILADAQPAGGSTLPDILARLAGRMKRRGMVMIVSDCFCDIPRLSQSIEQLRYFGHDVIVAQILAPEELTFPFRREAFFQDLELFKRMRINPNTVRKHYLKEFQAFRDRLQQAMTDLNVDLMTFSTADDLGDTLSFYLRRRAAMKMMGHARARA